jgi:cytochrome oxidase Cu insertion factor (SCO1/SenC/PrrC family)
MHGTLLGFASLALALVNATWFFGRMQRVALPQNRIAHDLLWAAALALGVAALASGAGWLGGVPAALGALAGGFMLLLRLGSAQAKNAPAVAVGGEILDFTAPDENGAPFSLSRIAGKPFLLKFFRGHW